MKRNLLVYFFLILILSAHSQSYVPITVTGFNADLIANGSVTPDLATTTDFDGDGAVYYSKGYSFLSPVDHQTYTGLYGLPSNGIVTSTGLSSCTRAFRPGRRS